MIAATTAILVALTAGDEQVRSTARAYWVFLDATEGAEVEVAPRALLRRAARGIVVAGADRRPHDGHVTRVAGEVERVRVTSRWLDAVSVEATEQQLVAVRALPFVSAVVPVARGRVPDGVGAWQTSERSFEPDPWPLALTRIDSLHARGLRGEGVCIGVVDSGFDLGHAAFAAIDVAAAHDFLDDDDIVADEPGDVPGQADHGTQTLALLAGDVPGEFTGVSPLSTYFLAKTEHVDEHVADEDRYVAGIEWLEAHGVDIISTSVGFYFEYGPDAFDGSTTPASQATRTVLDLGVYVVAAAGNAGPDAGTVGAPADVDGVLAVGAVDESGALATFSSRGPTADGRIKPDVVAPGVFVWTVAPGTPDQYLPAGGTSIAAPIVAGAAALVLEYTHGLPLDPTKRLRRTALAADDPDPASGWGLIDANAAAGPADFAAHDLACSVADNARSAMALLPCLLCIRRRRTKEP